MKAPSGPVRRPGRAKPKATGSSRAGTRRPSATRSSSLPKAGAKAKPAASDAVVLLAGGNPQIAKADGDAAVQAYIAAMPGWKRDAGKRLDALVVRCVPHVRKAVKWNSPLYGFEGDGWFPAQYRSRQRRAQRLGRDLVRGRRSNIGFERGPGRGLEAFDDLEH